MAATNPYSAPQSTAGGNKGTFLIFLASFLTLIAAGMGFGARGEVLGQWAKYGFTYTDLGKISGMGLAGFGLVILGASLITDRVGYRAIMLAAFLCHVISAVIMLFADYSFNNYGKDGAYWCLWTGNLIFAIGNGLCEAAINPLVATLYPNKKTHYLNILHAGWPAGLVLGALAGKFLGHYGWQVPILSFMIPALIYGFITLTQRFPESEATKAGVTYGEMFSQLLAPVLIFLMLIHAMVGYVELGTDSWISSITNKLSLGQGTYLFIFASSLMFVLRFFAGPIVEKINPLGLLFVSAILGAVGLYTISVVEGVGMVWMAVTIYALGKTFLWPTMLGVVGERFPKGGAVTMGMMGGIGMLSAGLLGVPGIGYKQDFFLTENLVNQQKAEATFNRYKTDEEISFLFLPRFIGVDQGKLKVALDPEGPATDLNNRLGILEKLGILKDSKDMLALQAWWESAKSYIDTDKKPLDEAQTYGGRLALRWTAIVPATMAVCYLLLILYFRATGGYKQEHLHTLTGSAAPNEY